MFEVLRTRHCDTRESGWKQYRFFFGRQKKDGLLRYARNDGVGALVAYLVMPAQAGIHGFSVWRALKVVDGGLRRHDGVGMVAGHA